MVCLLGKQILEPTDKSFAAD